MPRTQDILILGWDIKFLSQIRIIPVKNCLIVAMCEGIERVGELRRDANVPEILTRRKLELETVKETPVVNKRKIKVVKRPRIFDRCEMESRHKLFGIKSEVLKLLRANWHS